MGTSGIVHFHSKGMDSPTICWVYKQSDGYPESLGEQVKNCLGDANLVNGIRFDLDRQVNGMGCAAAQFIQYAKDGVGGIYMIPKAYDWADFDYHIYHDGDIPEAPEPPLRVRMKILQGDSELWDGEISAFDAAALYEDH